ncbi:hypothetical protein IFR04_000660 [Cadophora malorum]|uniref:Uncharacterized protein n=1 Tax=Cadophora malorum TaxID=108018 RepID=A0A8H7WJU5_9HELO|nr:hypothetical protein IFR04_000660 [Cadophora malorum]
MTSWSWLPSRRSSTQLAGPEQSSPTQSITGSSLSSTSTSPSSISSRRTHASTRSTRGHGPVVGIALSGSVQAARDVNLNVTITNAHINQSHPQPRGTLHDSGTDPAPPSRNGQISTPPLLPPASTAHPPSSVSSGDSTLVDNSPITRNGVQLLLNRIESLETRLLQANNASSSRSSRSFDISSRPMRHTPSSPALSTASDVSIPQPRSPNWLFLSSTQLPLSVPTGPLSISSDSSTSSAIMTPPSTQTSSDSATSSTIMTPSSSGTSTPTLPGPSSLAPAKQAFALTHAPVPTHPATYAVNPSPPPPPRQLTAAAPTAVVKHTALYASANGYPASSTIPENLHVQHVMHRGFSNSD